MNLTAIKLYQDNTNTERVLRSAIIKSSKITNNSATDMIQSKLSNTSAGAKEITAKNERNHNSKLFPENSPRLELHQVFNRNGKISSQSFNKGSLVDFTV